MTKRDLYALLGLLEEIEDAATKREIHRLRREFRTAVRVVLRALDSRRGRQ